MSIRSIEFDFLHLLTRWWFRDMAQSACDRWNGQKGRKASAANIRRKLPRSLRSAA
jgi:hypothetical protein